MVTVEFTRDEAEAAVDALLDATLRDYAECEGHNEHRDCALRSLAEACGMFKSGHLSYRYDAWKWEQLLRLRIAFDVRRS